MKKFKLNSKYIYLGLLFSFLGMGFAQAQQVPFSMNYLYRPGLINPAFAGARKYNNIHISHQQRKVVVAGWKSISQFVNYSSQPMGRTGNWGWGLNLINDVEHTETRTVFNGAIAVQVIRTKKARLSLGIDLGLINWHSNYDEVNVFDRNDPLLQSPGNFIELDAGVGFDYEFKSKKIWVDLGAAALQLPGNFLSSQATSLRLSPHAFAGTSVLFSPIHNVFIGPMAFYRNTVLRGDTVIGGGTLDIGLKGALDRQGIWAGASYRISKSALTFAFGMQIYASDTHAVMDRSGIFVDLNAGFSYPMQQASVFGPSLEIGLDIHFGRPYQNKNMIDSLRVIDGAFWKNDGNLNRHMEDFLVPNGPLGLRAESYVSPRNVRLTYQFADQSLLYVGTTPDIKADSLKSLGMEWVGVDGFLEGISGFVIKDALDPDSASVFNIDSLEALRSLVLIELGASLQASEEEVNELAEGTIYEGEFGTNNTSEDTLFIDVVYNDADTTVGVALNHYVTNLELACLKLHAMRMKLQYELEIEYGDKLAFVWEGEKIDSKIIGGRNVVRIKKLRVTPNHPNQDAFQVNEVSLKFNRYKKEKTDAKGNVVPDGFPDDPRNNRKKNRRNMGRRDRR